MTDFLEFKDVSIPTQKTKRYEVYSAHDGSYLGYIYWRTGWRRYVMHFDNECDWSIECMAQCYKFTQKLMEERNGIHNK